MAVVGIDLGGTKLASALFSDEGEIVLREVVPLSGREGTEVSELVGNQVSRLVDVAGLHQLQVSAVGVSVPGIFRSESGTVWAPNIPGWDDYPLGAYLGFVIGDGVSVRVDSDRACSILGEAWKGAARGSRHAIFLAVGTGIGAGILIDGRVLRGSHDIAGAIGWLALDRPYRSEYDACGCFEYHASGGGLARLASDFLAKDPQRDSLLRKDVAVLTAHEVFARYDEGDELAAEVMDVAIKMWGMAVANLVSLFDPELIVFGGGVFGPAARFVDRIREEAKRWAQPVSMPLLHLAVSELGSDAALYGAARLALDA